MDSCTGPSRTVADILKSCYWVIVVSIWASIHPNVPNVTYVHPETNIGNLLNQAMIMVVAFLAPELVMLWAMRQSYMAKRVAEKFQGYRWTEAHGFLVIMKGIALYDHTGFRYYLQYSKNGPDQKERDIIQEIDAILRLEKGNLVGTRKASQPDQMIQDTNTGHNLNSTTAQTNFPMARQKIRRIDTGTSPAVTITSPIQKHSPSPSGLRQREPTSIQSVTPDAVALPGDGHACCERNDLTLRHNSASPLSAHVTVDFGFEPSCDQTSSSPEIKPESPSGLLEYLLRTGLLNISETDITDTLNHGDTFAKLILVLQAAWFVSKMIGRISKDLYVTELEIVALASVLLSFVAQACWWGKPQRVRHPYKIMLPCPRRGLSASCAEPASNTRHKSFWGKLRSEISRFGERLYADFRGTRRIYPTVPLPVFAVGYPLYLLAAEISALVDADDFNSARTDEKGGSLDFLFSCGVDVGSTPKWIYGALYSISVMVGMLHFGAWQSTTFPPREHLWWRLSTVLVTVLPVVLATTYSCLRSRETSGEKSPPSRWRWVLRGLMRASYNLSVWLYLAARVALTVIALVELSRLSDTSTAFCDVEISLGFHIG
ncbi:hypothetical protein AAF712_007053 [Marasmius tenuissimus]|uniref:Uncharacterized protein n=1 Tax=Marasmius tenuissimus TaxID=585030 RepID=A0ABR2ZW69_9AGAR